MKVLKKKNFAFCLIISVMLLAFGFVGYAQAAPKIASADSQMSVGQDTYYDINGESDSSEEYYTPGLIFATGSSGYGVYSVGTALDNGNTVIVIPAIHDGQAVTTIIGRAFYGCSSMTSVTIPEGVTIIGHYAFTGCNGLTEITIPASVTEVGVMAFAICRGLITVTFAEGSQLTRLDALSFGDCNSLVSINIPNSVTYIEAQSFLGCTGITSITIPSGVTWVGLRTFGDWTSSQTIYIQGSSSMANSWEQGWNSNCSAQIIWSEEYYTPGLIFSGGIVYSVGTALDNGNTVVVIPKTYNGVPVTQIRNRAFYGCSTMTSITIPEGIPTIEHSTFYGCSSLTEITIPASVTELGVMSFANCSSLTTIIFAEGSQLTAIYALAFAGCNSLVNIINLPNGLSIL